MKLGWTDKGKIKWIKKEHHIFPPEIRELARINKLRAIYNCGNIKIRRFAAYKYTHGIFFYGYKVI